MMKFTYDKMADAVYLALNSKKIEKTVELNNSTILDLGAKGEIIGIEILNFNCY